jgi:hypothetical protein
MNQQDYPKFVEAFAVSHELQAGGKVLSNAAMFAAFKALSNYPLQLVLSAIDKHIQTARFAVTVSDIRDLLELGNKRLSAAEAWAEMPKEEQMCGVISDEMLAAWCICSDLYKSRQFFAAEKAFLSAYDRICKENELLGKPITWTFSRGDDKSNYRAIVDKAVELGRLPQSTADVIMLSAPEPATVNLAGLLSGKVDESLGEKKKRKLREVLALLEAEEEAEKNRLVLEKREKLERQQAIHAQAMMMLSSEERKKINEMSVFEMTAEDL